MNLSQLKSWACAASLVAALALGAQAQGNHFNTRGNILISDQYNNRVIEVNPNNHKVVWHFGNGSSVAGPHSVVGVNDAQRIGPFTLIAGTGVPARAEPTCPNGCADNRVMIVDPSRPYHLAVRPCRRHGSRAQPTQHSRTEHMVAQLRIF